MDKETLASYGWIVITLIVMMFLILLATPLGDYVGKTATNVKNGVMSVADKADYDKEKEDMNELFDGDDTGHGTDINQNTVKPSDSNSNNNNKTTYLMGDVNKDGEINSIDALYVSRYLRNMEIKNGKEIKEQWFNSETKTITSLENSSTGTLTSKFDTSSQTLTLNGAMPLNSHYYGNLITNRFLKDDTYQLELEYVSGSVSTDAINGDFGRSPHCITLDFYNPNVSKSENRHIVNVRLPNINGVARTNLETLTVTQNDEDNCTDLLLTLYAGDSAITFNNYKIKINVKKLKDTERVARANNFNGRALFQNCTDHGITQSWNAQNNTLTLNGTLGATDMTQGFGFSTQVDMDAQYKLTLTHMGGSATTTTSSSTNYYCIALDVMTFDSRRLQAIGRTRHYVDTYLPLLKHDNTLQPSTTSNTLIINASNNYAGMNTSDFKTMVDRACGLTLGIYSGGNATTFNNYTLKVELERLDKISAREYQKDPAGNDILSLDLAVADCDGDGQITEADNIILHQYLADWDSAKEIMRKSYEKYN